MVEINQLAEEGKTDIICLQEPYTKNGTITGLPTHAKCIIQGGNPMAAIIVFNPNIGITPISQLCDSHMVCVEILRKEGAFILASIYCQFQDEIEPYLNKIRRLCNLLQNKPIIIAMDANAKSPIWNSSTTDARGAKLEGLLQELDLDVCNKPSMTPTFHNRAGCKSNIDVTVASATAIMIIDKWEVTDNQTMSDHNMIKFRVLQNIKRNDFETSTEEQDHYNLKNANWDAFKENYRPPERPKLHSNIDHAARELTEAIKSATAGAIKSIGKGTRKYDTFWCQELEALRKRVRRHRRTYQNSTNPEARHHLLETYRYWKEIYKNRIEEIKIGRWERFVEQQLVMDPWGIPYKIMTEKINSSTNIPTLKKDDGTMTHDWRSSAELLISKLLPDDTEEGEDEEQKRTRGTSQLCNNTRIVAPFNNSEVHKIISELKPRKATGPDGIPNEFLMALTRDLTPHLCDIANACLAQGRFPTCWKEARLVIIKKDKDGDPTNPKGYRPICLINTMGKILEKLICKRIEEIWALKGINTAQYGFTKGRSTEDAINRTIEATNTSAYKYVLGISIDISGAFDNLWWPSLMERLQDIKCPPALYHLIKNYCKEREVFLNCPIGEVRKTTTKGCPQGSVCGPIFWNLCFEALISILETQPEIGAIVAFADDLMVLIEGNSRAELERNANKALQITANWCKRNKLSISHNKTGYLMLKGFLDFKRNPTIKINGLAVKRFESMRHLGVWLDEKLSFSNHVEQVHSKSAKLMNKISRIATTKFKLPLNIYKLYYNAILVAITSYAASVWSHRLKLVKPAQKIQTIQRQSLLRISGAFCTTSTDALNVLLGVTPLDLEVRGRGARYWLRKGDQGKVVLILGREANTTLEIKNEITNLWQERWDSSEKGRRVYSFLPSVRERTRMKHLQPTRGLIHFLSGHGPYATYLKKINSKPDDLCNICGVVGTPEHHIYECQNNEIDPADRERLRGFSISDIIKDPAKLITLETISNQVSNSEWANYLQGPN